MFERILLSIDGSPDSDKAVQLTGELARLHGSRVLVVHGRDLGVVALTPRPTAPSLEGWETEDEAQQLVDSAVSRLRAAGAEVRGQVLAGLGRVDYKILDAAEAEGADLIVLGSRGMSRIEEVLIGSVSHKIVHMAKCPVLLAR